MHYPESVPEDAPPRKYDCQKMADFYVGRFSYRFTSEMIYALSCLKDIWNSNLIKILSFGCGPCTDLLALDSLKKNNVLNYSNLEYRGLEYNESVWQNIHEDIKTISPKGTRIEFIYEDVCEYIKKISPDALMPGWIPDWIPDLVIFQYFFSDLHKNSKPEHISGFLEAFARFSNLYMPPKSYIVLNDINLGMDYNGGRDYFDKLKHLLNNCGSRKGRFRDDNTKSDYYPNGYPYGEDSDGEFPDNSIPFDIQRYPRYSPKQTCASARMIIKRR